VKGKLIPMQCDICDEHQVKAVFRYIGEKYDGIDLLINNANVITKGLILDDNNTTELQHIMETNILALCVITREGVKLMKDRPMQRKDLGHIVNINSIFGHKVSASVPGSKPMNGMYPASK
jgi:NADP-dependent 3-hydroxy acid dehydrogenase YdfG